MLEVKKARAAAARNAPTTAQYLDRMQREGRPLTVRNDDRPPLVIEGARAYQLLWELVDRIETIEAVREGLQQMERGEVGPRQSSSTRCAGNTVSRPRNDIPRHRPARRRVGHCRRRGLESLSTPPSSRQDGLRASAPPLTR